MRMINYRESISFLLAIMLISFCANAQNDGTSNTVKELTFEEALNRVFTKNHDYIEQEYDVKISEAEISASKVFNDPEVEFSAEHEGYGVGLTYEFSFGKRRARIKFAKAESEKQKLEFEQFLQDLRSETAVAFLEAVMQKDLLQTKKESYDYMRQLYVSDSIRFRLGEISENDVIQTRIELISLGSELYEQEAEYEASLLELYQIMGGNEENIDYDPISSFKMSTESFNLNDLYQIAIDNRPEVRTAQKSVDIAEIDLSLTKAERRPDFEIGLGYGTEWAGPYMPNNETLNASLKIPLKFSNFNKGEVRVKQYELEKERNASQKLFLELKNEVTNAYVQHEVAKKQIQQFDLQLLNDAKKLLEGMVYSYKRGEVSALEALMAQRTYNEVQELYITALNKYVTVLVELEKACGTWKINF